MPSGGWRCSRRGVGVGRGRQARGLDGGARRMNDASYRDVRQGDPGHRRTGGRRRWSVDAERCWWKRQPGHPRPSPRRGDSPVSRRDVGGGDRSVLVSSVGPGREPVIAEVTTRPRSCRVPALSSVEPLKFTVASSRRTGRMPVLGLVGGDRVGRREAMLCHQGRVGHRDARRVERRDDAAVPEPPVWRAAVKGRLRQASAVRQAIVTVAVTTSDRPEDEVNTGASALGDGDRVFVISTVTVSDARDR